MGIIGTLRILFILQAFPTHLLKFANPKRVGSIVLLETEAERLSDLPGCKGEVRVRNGIRTGAYAFEAENMLKHTWRSWSLRAHPAGSASRGGARRARCCSFLPRSRPELSTAFPKREGKFHSNTPSGFQDQLACFL